MKLSLAVLMLLGLAQDHQATALQLKADIQYDSIWDDAMSGADTTDYSQDSPKAYVEKEKPKVDTKALERKKRAQQALAAKKAEE